MTSPRHRHPLPVLLFIALTATVPSAHALNGEVAPPLAAAIDRAIETPGDWDSLRLLVECREEAGAGSVEVFGNGVGLWAGRRQFTLTVEEIATLLERMRAAGFPRMKASYGGKGLSDPGRPGEGRDPANASVRVCAIDLEIDGEVKRVVQLAPGLQSPELMGLAADLLDATREPGEAGVAAADLEDGLRKLGAGELAPEALRLTFTRRPGSPTAATGPSGFLLRLHGRRALTREFVPGQGYGPALEVTLDAEELAAVAGALVEAEPAAMPANLWAESYTDLAVEVLGRRKAIQARQFAGLGPSTHGEVQRRFDRLVEVVEQLEQQVRINGVPRAEG